MKSYTYKMKMLPANILAITIFIILIIVCNITGISPFNSETYTLPVIGLIFIYFFLHELMHGLGYVLGGAKKENIKYGIALEKGIFYAMCNQEITKENILLSLQMPFTVLGVITLIIGLIFKLPILTLLSICNISGASMDLVMFFYILRMKNVKYSESGNCDEFVLISKEDLEKKKSIFFKIVNVKKYNEKDFIFDKNVKKIKISKKSVIITIIFFIICLLSIFL